MPERRLRLSVLYPTLMNLYGDRGNAIGLRHRAEARGIETEIIGVDCGDAWNPGDADIVLIGGGQDREQRRIHADLAARGQVLRDYRDEDGVILAVCGGYQLFGTAYLGLDGQRMEGAGVFDAVSCHPGQDFQRCVGNVAALWEGETLVGFENHGGRTYLSPDQTPLADVVSGFGNNGGDATEGARSRNAFGTYMHGSLLPKNPRLADRLIQLALQRRYGEAELQPLDDTWERRGPAEALHAALAG